MVSKYMEVGIVAALVGLSSAACAGPTSEWRYIGEFQQGSSTSGLASTPFQNSGGLGTRFESNAWSSAATTDGSASVQSFTPASLAARVAAQDPAANPSSATDERRRALAVSSGIVNSSPVVGSPAALDLTLWNFIFNIRAQQTGNQFQTLRTSSENIDYTLNGVPAPVPLPAPSWLLLAGLAALFAPRLAGRLRSRVARRESVALPV